MERGSLDGKHEKIKHVFIFGTSLREMNYLSSKLYEILLRTHKHNLSVNCMILRKQIQHIFWIRDVITLQKQTSNINSIIISFMFITYQCYLSIFYLIKFYYNLLRNLHIFTLKGDIQNIYYNNWYCVYSAWTMRCYCLFAFAY